MSQGTFQMRFDKRN